METRTVQNGLGIHSSFLRVAEAARYLAISKSKVYQMIDSGELAHARFGGAVRIPREAIEEYAKRCTVGASA